MFWSARGLTVFVFETGEPLAGGLAGLGLNGLVCFLGLQVER